MRIRGTVLLLIRVAPEIIMHQNPLPAEDHHSGPNRLLRRVMGGMSLFTMFMTIPQVMTIWIGRQAGGVSLLSWSAYLVSAVLWLWFGIQKRDKNIYLPCVGWIVLDIGVIAGVFIYG